MDLHMHLIKGRKGSDKGGRVGGVNKCIHTVQPNI